MTTTSIMVHRPVAGDVTISTDELCYIDVAGVTFTVGTGADGILFVQALRQACRLVAEHLERLARKSGVAADIAAAKAVNAHLHLEPFGTVIPAGRVEVAAVEGDDAA